MKDVLKNIVQPIKSSITKLCVAREYLQARVLQTLQDEGVFQKWAFVGGTSLRFLFSIPRFSEDLDFSLIQSGSPAGFADAMKKITTTFSNEAYEVGVVVKDEKAVASAFLKFSGLLYEIGISPHRSQVFSIKIEVDTNPPAGARLQTTFVRRHVTLNLVHYDKASLLAGKLHAVLTRRYTKGRDLYDLLWYLADRSWPAPNLELLNTALAQTGWTGQAATEENWRSLVIGKLDAINWTSAKEDVAPFLEREKEADMITRENLMSVLRK